MKPWIPILLVLAAGAAGWLVATSEEPTYDPLAPIPTAAAIPRALAEPAGDGEVVRSFAVEGMCCNGCAPKVHDALARLEGVHEVAVDVEAGTASVRVSEAVAPATLEAALAFDDYSGTLLP